MHPSPSTVDPQNGVWALRDVGSMGRLGEAQMPDLSSPFPDPGLTKEPVLWTLVSKEPPAPADGNWDAGCDQCPKSGLSLNWQVPHVQVKDIPNFEQLSPELEAGRDSSCICLPTRALHSGDQVQEPCLEGTRGLEEDRTHLLSTY